ncbi:MAG: septal ring lytic transglycosylase RlpA family protein [Desulfobacteraceae bacterium]|nr:septal ring lytic transglycosylase RlpA family protein [Desulfobacteraceae bacterium]MCB9494243.1 septal ring lytic transglycosylase RlpA family protein [Desulfobacteraceae bacterium]
MKTEFYFIFILVIAVLSSCSSKPEKSYEEKGTGSSYYVYGKKYTTITSSKGFYQSGTASWYGKKFHGRKTANGETYNMHQMTCAHKTLPFNTELEVENLINNKKIIVRVNDRGPFVKGRIIDLSYKAAKELGIDISGTAPVTIKSLHKGNFDKGDFSVQTGSFANHDNALNLKKELLKQFSHVFITSAEINGQTFYRVRAGKFKSLEQAQVNEEKLRNNGFPNAFAVALD